MIQFPEKFQERMQQMLGDEEYAEFLKSYDLPFHNGYYPLLSQRTDNYPVP